MEMTVATMDFEFGSEVLVEGLDLPPTPCIGIETRDDHLAVLGSKHEEIPYARIQRSELTVELQGEENTKGFARLNVRWGDSRSSKNGVVFTTDEGGLSCLRSVGRFLRTISRK